MAGILHAAALVSTPLAFLSFVAAIGYFAYTRRLKYEEKKLEALPLEQRATRTDEYLTRYGIDGKRLPVADKLALIKDEMEKRHRRSNLYVIVLAVVFIVCFGLAVSAFVVEPAKAPAPQPKTTFRVIDAQTKDSVFRDLEVRYSVAGAPEERILRPSQGQFELPTGLADIKTLKVICPPYRTYSFDADQPQQLVQTNIELGRKPSDDELDFAAAITPLLDADYFTNEVPPKEYQRQVKDQVVGEPIGLQCHNQSTYHLDLILYKWIPSEKPWLLPDMPPPQFPPSWTMLAPTCKPSETITYSIGTYDQQGVYYFVFGSVGALKATLLWHGNLHRSNPPTLEVFLDDAGSKPGNPKLNGKLMN